MRKRIGEQIVDILFIMLLCFVSLLIPMLYRGKVLVGSGSSAGLVYSFEPWSFILIVGVIGALAYFIISQSDRELRKIIDKVYRR
jgi:hypothetical protein